MAPVRKHILVTKYCITLNNSDKCRKRIFNINKFKDLESKIEINYFKKISLLHNNTPGMPF